MPTRPLPDSAFQMWRCPKADDTLTVAAFQMSMAFEIGIPERIERALAMFRIAQEAVGPGVFVLPEYYLANFHDDPAQTAAQAETVPGPGTEPFLDFAHQSGCTVLVGLLEKSGDPSRPYNTEAILGPDGVVGCYHKAHLWDLGPKHPGKRECQLFTPGDELAVYDVAGWKAGTMICADGSFPETARVLAIKGAEVIFYPNCRDAVRWEVETACFANLIPIVVCNPVGKNSPGPGGGSKGTSRIVGPWGKLLAAVDEKQPREGWCAAELDRDYIRSLAGECERHRRRPDLYGPLTEPFPNPPYTE